LGALYELANGFGRLPCERDRALNALRRRALARYRPTAHVFVGSKASWYEIVDDLPQYDGSPWS